LSFSDILTKRSQVLLFSTRVLIVIVFVSRSRYFHIPALRSENINSLNLKLIVIFKAMLYLDSWFKESEGLFGL